MFLFSSEVRVTIPIEIRELREIFRSERERVTGDLRILGNLTVNRKKIL
jgi:hypothetical protein